MSDDIIKRLRAIAAGTRPGEWRVSKHRDGRNALIYDANEFEVARVCYPNRDANALYIAAASPDNITALLDRLDKAEREIERLHEDAERLDSGLIRLVDRDEFGESVATVYSQVDLRAAIDAARAAEQSDERREG